MKKSACKPRKAYDCFYEKPGDCDFYVGNHYNGGCLYRCNGIMCGNKKAWEYSLKEDGETQYDDKYALIRNMSNEDMEDILNYAIKRNEEMMKEEEDESKHEWNKGEFSAGL